MSQVLQSKIAAVRSKHTLVCLAMGIALAVGVFVSAIGISALADWLFDFPWAFRAVLLAAYIVAAMYFLARHGILPIVYGPDDEDIALCVERDNPTFASRLIASVQLSQPGAIPAGASASIVRAMVAQTEELSETIDFPAVIKTDLLLRTALIVATSLVIWSAAYIYGGESTHDLLQRAFLSHVSLPTKTRVEIVSGEFALARGDNATLSAKAVGWHPSGGTAEIYYSSRNRETIPLALQGDLYAGTLQGVQESFSYRIRLFDGKSEWYKVTVVPRPTVANLECTQIYPEYTGMPDQPRATSDLSLLVGSKLRLKITANKPVRLEPTKDGLANKVLLFTSDKEVTDAAWQPLTVDPNNRRQLSATLDLPAKVIGFSIHLVDDYGIPSKDPAIYRVDLIPDRPPTIRITSPDRKEVLATASSRLDLGFIAEDDYAVAKVTLKYKVDEGEEQSVPLAIAPRQRQIRGYYPWSIAKIPIPADKATLEGSVIEYHLEVEDNNTLNGPGRYASEKYLARVVTKAEKQAELMARLGESLGSLRDVSDNQEKASQELGTLILEAPSPRK